MATESSRHERGHMNEQGDIYFGENPPSEDIERLRAELESERRDATVARMDRILYAARTELWNQPEGRR